MNSMMIVGAAGGIGDYLCHRFWQEYRLLQVVHKNCPEIHDEYRPQPIVIQTDIAQAWVLYEDELRALGDRIVLINAAGISIDGMGHKLPPSDFSAVLNTNLLGVFNVCRRILPLMRQSNWGRIINLSSVVGQIGVSGTAAYAASKAGLEGLTRTLAIENARKGITVNTLRLGYMDIGMINTLSYENRQAAISRVPMLRLGHPENIVHAIKFLVAADYVTGTTIDIDGGVLCS